MAHVLYANNDNTFRVSPIRRESDNAIETSVVFSVTLYDSDDNPISGVTALSTVYRPSKQDNAVVFNGSGLNRAEASGSYIDAAATGAFADKINFEDVPVIVQKRKG